MTWCEVGCGAGEVLRQLWLSECDTAKFVGYDVSPEAHALARTRVAPRLDFRLGQAADDEHYDVMLVLDVLEHVPDCIGFLRSLRAKADWMIVHIPLELCVQAVLRRDRLRHSRDMLGHLHFFNEELAIATLRDGGFFVADAIFTCGGAELPPQSVLSWLAREPRRLMGLLSEPLAARILGGFSLLVLARADGPLQTEDQPAT